MADFSLLNLFLRLNNIYHVFENIFIFHFYCKTKRFLFDKKGKKTNPKILIINLFTR